MVILQISLMHQTDESNNVKWHSKEEVCFRAKNISDTTLIWLR
jgi:hypothetical protein